MMFFASPVEWMLGLTLIFSALGVVLASQPVHSCLSFLLTLVSLAALYLKLSAHFLAAMQVLVYAGAILVIFMFVIVLFQDAHSQIAEHHSKSTTALLALAAIGFVVSLIMLGSELINGPVLDHHLPESYGTVQILGKALYVDFFFPFEAVILIFLVAVVGALYTGKKVEQ